MSFKDGRIGVGKDPIFPLDVGGSCRIDGDLILGGRFSDSSGPGILECTRWRAGEPDFPTQPLSLMDQLLPYYYQLDQSLPAKTRVTYPISCIVEAI